MTYLEKTTNKSLYPSFYGFKGKETTKHLKPQEDVTTGRLRALLGRSSAKNVKGVLTFTQKAMIIVLLSEKEIFDGTFKIN